MSLGGLLKETCTIQRPTITRSSIASSSEEYVRVDSEVPCDIQMLGTSEVMQFGRVVLRRRMIGYFNRDQDIRNRDQVLWNGLILNVRGAPLLEVDQAPQIVAMLEEVT